MFSHKLIADSKKTAETSADQIVSTVLMLSQVLYSIYKTRFAPTYRADQ